ACPRSFFAGTAPMNQAVAAFAPDAVHVNGFDYPLAIRGLARAISRPRAIVVQDHGGFVPEHLSVPREAWLRWGLRRSSMLLVATPPQIESFESSGLVPPGVAVRDVMEGSTTLRADPSRAVHRPLALLCVGRLNANKDPIAVLRGFERFAAWQPD